MRNLRSSATSRHALVIAFAILAAAGAPAPANAACKSAELTQVDTVSLGGSTWKVGYVCWNNCGVTKSSAPLIEEILLVGETEMFYCRARCSGHSDCYSVSYHDTVVWQDGREQRARVCRLWGRGDIETVDTLPPPGRPFDYTVVCRQTRDQTPPWQRGLDLDKFHQDQQRPGVPRPGVPLKP